MGLRQVRIANALIEKCLSQGNVIDSVRVDGGLPDGARLVAVTVDAGWVTAIFEHESWADTPAGKPLDFFDVQMFGHHWEGPYSLWSCNGCEWRGYLMDTLTSDVEPSVHLCPVCEDECEMVSDVDLRRMVEIGLHYTAGTQISDETQAWLASAKGEAMRPVGDGLTLADVLAGRRSHDATPAT